MSFSAYNPQNLRAPTELNIKFVPLPQAFTTATIRRETLLEFNKLYKRAVIENNDTANQVLVRVEPFGTQKIVPASSRLEIEEWHSFLEVVPDAVTGTGRIELDLVDQEEAIQRGK